MLNQKLKSILALGLSTAALSSFPAISTFASAPSGPSETPLPGPFYDYTHFYQSDFDSCLAAVDDLLTSIEWYSKYSFNIQSALRTLIAYDLRIKTIIENIDIDQLSKEQYTKLVKSLDLQKIYGYIKTYGPITCDNLPGFISDTFNTFVELTDLDFAAYKFMYQNNIFVCDHDININIFYIIRNIIDQGNDINTPSGKEFVFEQISPLLNKSLK